MSKVILVVEDSPSIRKFISLALKIQSYKVITAEDGMQALEILSQENQVDLVLTDLNMPNMDGIELIKEIRKNPNYVDLPIIILSSLTSERDINEGLDAGADSYLIKPFNTKKIQYEISKYL
ncbi:MAG: response regulator [Candidatus Kapabacteria bacterium]|nr:response regulator [Ignavibacteriota bacterium]MCW5884620.1 response regulator [Candidatus Kapabacteria bacterium]